MRDLYHSVLVTQLLSPVVSTTLKTSARADLQGFNSATILFAIGQAGDTLSTGVNWIIKLQHSDDDSTYTDTASTDINSGIPTITLNAPSMAGQAYNFGYIGGKRYIRGVAVPSGTMTVGTPIGIVALSGTAGYRPVVYP